MPRPTDTASLIRRRMGRAGIGLAFHGALLMGSAWTLA